VKVRFLHSTGTGPSMWDRTLAALSHLDIDASAVPSLGYEAGAPIAKGREVHVADHLAHLAAALPSEPFHLVAHSFGAFLALELLRASAVGARVASLWVWEPVLFGALARSAAGSADDPLVAGSWLVHDEQRGGDDTWLAHFVDYWSGEGAFAKIPERMRAPMRALGWTMFQEVRATALSPVPFEAYVVEVPLTLAFGAGSPSASRAMTAALAERLPRARVEPHEGLHHMAPAGRPKDVVPSIEAHLVRAGARPKTAG